MIDWSRVAELRDEIGAEDFDEVLELFLDEVGGAVAALPGSVDDAKQVEEQMHFLKGAAMNLGFDALSSLCRKGEEAAKAGDAFAVSPQEVATCYDQSKALFETEYVSRFAA